MKLGAPSLHFIRLLDQVRERFRYKHYIVKNANITSIELDFSFNGGR
jgi:hypothetical protein